MDEYAVRGKLKIKKGSGVKKKSGVKQVNSRPLHEDSPGPVEKSTEEKFKIMTSSSSAGVAKKTSAEVKFETRQQKLQMDRIMKRAEKSHKERVADLNQKLETMTEFNDIPKVSWTK